MNRSIIKAVALLTPALRLIVAEARGVERGGEPDAEIALYPVLALRASIHERSGGDDLDTEALFYHPPLGMIVAMSDPAFRDTSNILELFACPWPPEEDDNRLQRDLDQLREQAARRANQIKDTGKRGKPVGGPQRPMRYDVEYAA